jgi:hypothetical protein
MIGKACFSGYKAGFVLSIVNLVDQSVTGPKYGGVMTTAECGIFLLIPKDFFFQMLPVRY